MTIHSAPPADLLQNLVQTLVARLGPSHVLTAASDMAGHLVESRGLYAGAAWAVARPKDTEEVSFVVSQCARANVPIVPQGGNTGLVGGGVPHRGVVLSLARLDRIREVDPVNATMTVEAGCILKTVQDAAEAADCLFPLSLASEGSCRIGGNLATNAGGTAVLRYGNSRDLVLGLEVVLADGRVWNGLKGLRKDNMGYDLKNLFVGSEGTLGIITAAMLKMYPRQRASATAFTAVQDVKSAVALLGELRDALGDRLTGFELISAPCVSIARGQFPALPDPLPGHPWYAFIQA